jgi:DeoR/GlpR family transcriptional regulator of sugar metabolism
MPAERRRLILETLREHGSVTVDQVQREFGVSSMTARRDLAILNESGHLLRTHGGAILRGGVVHEHPFRRQLEQHVRAKRRLAGAVMGALDAHETVFLDSSSSSFYVARQIIDGGLPATLITNSLPVIRLFSDAIPKHVELIGLGGAFRKPTQSFVDPLTIRTIERFSADRVIFSVNGIAPDGSLTDPDPDEATVKRAMINHARTVILIAAAETFRDRGPHVIAPAASVDAAYLADPPIAGVERLEALGVRITRV